MLDIDIAANHPLFNPLHFHLETARIDELESEVKQWIYTGATGGLILGPARCGKTRAIHSITHAFADRFDRKVPVHYVTVPERDRATIASILRTLCISFQLPVRIRDTSDHFIERVIFAITDRVEKSQVKQFILIVDEMQRLAISQLGVFAELYDIMREQFSVEFSVIFVANDLESNTLLKELEGNQHAHIRGRFFNHMFRFGGIKSRKEIERCLVQYDQMRYPEEGGPTYTEFFLPPECPAGFRLKELAPLIWDVFSDTKKQLKLDDWPMHYFVRTVNTLLTDYIPNTGVDTVDEEVIQDCIRISGLIPSLANFTQK